MAKIFISVAIATFNGERYIREQLDSLYAQSRKPDEVIVSDDNSQDDTISILEEYRVSYGLKYFKNTQSLGVNKNFEKAIRNCSGNYIMICDQDDIWLSNKIEVSIKHMIEQENKWGPDCAVLISSEASSFIDGSSIDIGEKPNKGTVTYYRDFLFSSNQYCQGCTMMLNRPLLDRLPPFPNTFHDFPYDAHIAVISVLIGKRCHIKQELMLYRHHSNNVVVNLKKRISIIKRIYNIFSKVVYSFYNVPYPRQNYYFKLIEKMGLIIDNDSIKRDVFAIVCFSKSRFMGKIEAIMSVSVDKAIKWRQLARTVLTYPFRIIVPKPIL